MPRHSSPEAFDFPDILAPPPVIFGSALLLGILLGRRQAHPSGGRVVAAFAAAAGCTGIGCGLGAILALRAAGTALDPYKPATALVTSGMFSRSRNPAYLGATALYVSVALAARSVPALALLPIALGILERGVVEREERYLERRFGDEYRRYVQQVPRWF